MADYRIIDKETYYRNGVFRHFSEDCKCSTSLTSRIDVTEQLKAQDQMLWISRMNNIQDRAMEIVNHERIYAY